MTISALRPDDLVWSCVPEECDATEPSTGNLIGQERAVAALRLGLELYGPGYNIYVSGLTGTRRAQGVLELIRELRTSCRVAPDRVFVHNFEEPHRPTLLTFPKGEGGEFATALERFARGLMSILPRAFSSAVLHERRRALEQQFSGREQLLYHDLAEECQQHGLALVQLGEDASRDADVYPVIDDKPTPPEALEILLREGKLEPERARELEKERERLVKKLFAIRGRSRQLALALLAARDDLFRATSTNVVSPLLEELRARWQERACQVYFERLGAFLVERGAYLAGYREAALQAGADPDRLPAELEVFAVPRGEPTDGDGWPCPLLFEAHPSYENLFGNIRSAEREGPRVAHIEVGSLLRADGGYLVLRVADLVEQPEVWPALKRVLKTNLTEIRPVPLPGQVVVSPLRPDPIEIHPKVVLIGEPGSYERLAQEDPEFAKVFKVHAQFDTTMLNSPENRRRYAAFAAGLAKRENLKPPASGGLGRLIQHGARLAGTRRRLSTRFGELADLYREASYGVTQRGGAEVELEDVLEAERRRVQRISLFQEKYLEGVRDGRYRLEIAGERVGQINGLVVIDTGAYVYGRPTRLTAQVGVGSRGIVNIERETALSGPIHAKGVQILGGYLLGTFASNQPLCLDATLCFEQSYTGVEGDSASSTELYAILSALARVPLRQGLAVTGSVDQFGRIQAVGGVNEKIEGYFRVCEELGLNGEQGVLIPQANVEDLMLAPEVLAAVRGERFRVYAITGVDEGIELLTGMPAGRPDDAGETVLGRARRRLESFAQAWREYRQ